MDDGKRIRRVARSPKTLIALIHDISAAGKAMAPHHAVEGKMLWEAKSNFDGNSRELYR